MTLNLNHSFIQLVTKCQLCARDIPGPGNTVDKINRAKVHTVTEKLGSVPPRLSVNCPPPDFCGKRTSREG